MSDHPPHDDIRPATPGTPKTISRPSHREDADEHTTEGRTQSALATQNLTYNNDEEAPVFHARTYLAVLALFLLNLVQVFALTGPAAILEYIGEDLDGSQVQTWVPNALSLVQAIGGPIISFASDTFQARKQLLIGACTISFIGAAIAPNAGNIYRVIGAQIMIGFGFAAVPLAYAIPSEILPRKWRPVVQSGMNVAASLGAIISPVIGGALTKHDTHTGWRDYYWIQMGLWGLTIIGILFGYRPPKRHTALDHLSMWQKLGRLDLPGMGLLTVGLTLLLTGLSLGGNPWAWKNARVVATLVIGTGFLVGFGLYEWKGTKTGILHHELLGRIFPICVALIFIEGIELFTIIVFYPAWTSALFESGPLLDTVRTTPFWICAGLMTMIYGYWSTKQRDIRSPLLAGFVLFTAGLIGFTTIQPGQNARMIVFDGLAGLGFGSPLILIIAAVQLSTPHHLIATATAVITSSRAVAASTFTAIYGAVLTQKTTAKLPEYVAKAAIEGGLPTTSVHSFVAAILSKDTASLPSIPGVTPAIIAAGIAAVNHALADSFRIIYIIAVPFGVVACILCWFLGDMSSLMTYRVDAPVERLHARNRVNEEKNLPC